MRASFPGWFSLSPGARGGVKGSKVQFLAGERCGARQRTSCILRAEVQGKRAGVKPRHGCWLLSSNFPGVTGTDPVG